MICCTECFKDLELKASIESIGKKGNCPICNKKNVYIYDSNYDRDNTDLEEKLTSILTLYKPVSNIENCSKENGRTIEKCICEDWDFFNIKEMYVREILTEIINNSLSLDHNLLTEDVLIPELYDEGYLNNNSVLKSCDWKFFKEYMRNVNRFHNDLINKNVLKDLLKETEITIPRGSEFFRARICDKNGIKKNDMGAPPPDIASPGRANSRGQSCLYLCNKKETTLKEIRANVYDYVTIGNFVLNEPIKVLDLTTITHNSPFYSDNNKINYLLNEKHLREIEKDISKPMSRLDSELDYLPTQYISDFARFLGYDGIKYNSTFDEKAYNIALYNPGKCNCRLHKLHYVKNMKFETKTLTWGK